MHFRGSSAIKIGFENQIHTHRFRGFDDDDVGVCEVHAHTLIVLGKKHVIDALLSLLFLSCVQSTLKYSLQRECYIASLFHMDAESGVLLAYRASILLYSCPPTPLIPLNASLRP